ncbi:MAG: peptidoglycan-binding protein, partial [Oscillospiraceae bacterium]|nr:peptidoglycan-binding protein [Oscillospiraceae bacterium]
MTVLIFNQNTNRMERFTRALTDAMPYNVGRTLSLREFRGSSCSDTLWSDLRTMEAWNRTRATYGRPIHVGFAFKRIWEGGHTAMSQHYGGVAFDVGQTLSAAQRAELHASAVRFGRWSYVEPR